ncbi:hypothetical protein BDZ89DRAFT_1146246 [Hymenopellis radicata]|nr:hypothetical protein BDZ89DRAFT_1146246 [Hymenopellis radicata]
MSEGFPGILYWLQVDGIPTNRHYLNPVHDDLKTFNMVHSSQSLSTPRTDTRLTTILETQSFDSLYKTLRYRPLIARTMSWTLACLRY